NTPSSYSSRLSYINGKYEKHRKCVYRDGYKLTVNGTDGIIEEFMKNGKDIGPADKKNKTVVSELLDEISEFKGSERFSMPSV
ncbi:MAG: hypothetical protein KGH58_04150, partial [Candidatus Micrarchaeota archaeon]|nr:hypothetical protein [Candidatus Micrarchaeota archaeon]